MSLEYLECDTSSAVQLLLAFCSQPREVSRLEESPQELNLVQCRVVCLLSAENRLGETMKSPACHCLDAFLGSRANLDSSHVTCLTQSPRPIKPLRAGTQWDRALSLDDDSKWWPRQAFGFGSATIQP